MLREWTLLFFFVTLAGLIGPGTILLLFLFLAPIFLVFLTWIFIGSCFLLILWYPAVKVVPFDNVTILGVVLRLSTIFSPISLFFLVFFFAYILYQKFYLLLVLRPCLKQGQLSMLIVQLEYLYLFVFFYPQYTKHLFYILISSTHSKKSSSRWLIAYVLCFKVSPLLDKTYKYLQRE